MIDFAQDFEITPHTCDQNVKLLEGCGSNKRCSRMIVRLVAHAGAVRVRERASLLPLLLPHAHVGGEGECLVSVAGATGGCLWGALRAHVYMSLLPSSAPHTRMGSVGRETICTLYAPLHPFSIHCRLLQLACARIAIFVLREPTIHFADVRSNGSAARLTDCHRGSASIGKASISRA